MNKDKNNINDYVGSYDTIRPLLRLMYIQGCYSREDIKDCDMSGEKYDQELFRLRQLYDKDILQETRHGKYIVNQLKYRPFITVQNFLAESYRLKGLTEHNLTLHFHIQQILQDKVKPLNSDSFLDSLEKLGLGHISKNTLVRKLNSMSMMGILQVGKDGRRKTYSIAEDPFEGLSVEDLLDLYLAVDFFTNTTYPRLLGHFLKKSLYNYLIQKHNLVPGPDIFNFQHNTFHDVLDEEVVWYILHAIEHQNMLQFVYTSWKRIVNESKTVIPIKLLMDSCNGRWYLLAREIGFGLSVYRLSQIKNVVILEEKVPTPNSIGYEDLLSQSWGVSIPKPGSLPTTVLIRFKDEPGKSFVRRRVEREGKWGQVFVINVTDFNYKIDVTDLSGITPWIRGFGHRAEVLEPKKLREKFKKDWEEMHQNYVEGTVVAKGNERVKKKFTLSTKHKHHICGDKVHNMMEMFTEENNRSVVAIKALIELMCKEATSTLSEAKIKKFMTDNGVRYQSNDFYNCLFNKNSNKKNNFHLLVKEKEDSYSLLSRKALPRRPLSSELMWLNYILADPKIHLFLKPRTLGMLSQSFGQKKVNWQKYLEIRRETTSTNKVENYSNLRESFDTIVRAIREHKAIRYCATTRQEECFIDTLSFPYKIEYSMKHEEYYVIMLSIDDNRPIKSLLRNLSQIRCEDIEPQIVQDFIEVIEKKKHHDPIKLEVTDLDNALERSLLTLLVYEKSAYYDRKRETYTLTIYYYDFDEAELLSKILSLGKRVKITSASPELEKEVILRISAAAGLYSE